MLSLIPFVLFGFYNYSLVIQLLEENTKTQGDSEISNVLNEKYLVVEKDAEGLGLKLKQVEANLNLLQKQIEYLYSNNKDMRPDEKIVLEQDSKGFLWQPYTNSLEQSGIFVSAISNKKENLNKELITIKEIDTLLKGIFNNSLIAHSIWFCHSSSAILAYPAYNFKEKIYSGELPPDLNIQDYEFYYVADQTHNPNREIKWTNPYNFFTYYSSWVISATIPIYSNTKNHLIGVVGVDIPLQNLSINLQKAQFSKENSLTLITDEKNNILAYYTDPSNHDLSEVVSEFKIGSGNKLSGLFKSKRHISKVTIKEKDYYLISSKIGGPKWTYSVLIPKKELTQTILEPLQEKENYTLSLFFSKLIMTGFISIGFIIVISYIFSYCTTKPLVSLSKALRDFTIGKMYRIKANNKDEVGELIHSYNNMSIKIESLLANLKCRALEIQEKSEKLEQANENLVKSNERFQKLEETKAELIMQISHDLKTPLTSIKGTVEILDQYGLPTDERKKHFEHILLKMNHILALIDDLSEISQLDSLDIKYNKEYIPIDMLLDHSLDLASTQIYSKKVEFIREYPSDLIVFVDPQKMNRALYNILVNCIKYTESHETKVSVRAYLVNKEWVRIEIEDNGMGISPENLSKIFEKFYRERRNIESGSGLGMTITKKIVENHGGIITVDSKLNEGTTVTIELPH